MTERELLPPVRITVLMPVYNGADYIDEAIDSILNQTFEDFELLVIDDGSTDSSANLVAALNDVRIRLLRQPQNLGLVAALNRGLDEARGEYVARMDADDISLPQRFEKQLAFLDAHPEVGACGSWMESFSSTEKVTWTAPVDHDEIFCRLLFESVLYHPTVVFRRNMFEQYGLRYDPDYPCAEDYELWCRCARYFQLANLGEVLLHYRLHSESIGGRKREEKLATASRVRDRMLKAFGLVPSAEDLSIHNKLARWETPAEPEFLDQGQNWLLRLQAANQALAMFSEPMFSAMLAERWYHTCERASSIGIMALRAWSHSPLRRMYSAPWQRRLKFLGKCLVKM